MNQIPQKGRICYTRGVPCPCLRYDLLDAYCDLYGDKLAEYDLRWLRLNICIKNRPRVVEESHEGM